jgi:hypothetical protein
MKFTVLKFKDAKTAKGVGRYAVPMVIEEEVLGWAGCETPSLMNETVTIDVMERLYPTLDFNEVDLVTVTLTEGDGLLDEVDELLALLEGSSHGQEGKRITEMRTKIQIALE